MAIIKSMSKAPIVRVLRKTPAGRFLLRHGVILRNRAIPGLRPSPFPQSWAESRQYDLPSYILDALTEYAREISPTDRATSLECAKVLWRLGNVLDTHTVVDLGSGFSSYLLRCWARNRSSRVRVISADDNPMWLETTRLFLKSQGLPTEDLLLWDDLKDTLTEYRPDLILHDLGRMVTRIETLPTVLDAMHPGTWVVLDDMHKQPYRSIVAREARARGLFAYDLANLTFDDIGRHSWLLGRRPWSRHAQPGSTYGV